MNELWQTWVKLNRQYDKLPEPRRFLTFFIPAATFIVVIHTLRLYAIEYDSVDAAAGAITVFVVMAVIGAARFIYIKKT